MTSERRSRKTDSSSQRTTRSSRKSHLCSSAQRLRRKHFQVWYTRGKYQVTCQSRSDIRETSTGTPSNQRRCWLPVSCRIQTCSFRTPSRLSAQGVLDQTSRSGSTMTFRREGREQEEGWEMVG